MNFLMVVFYFKVWILLLDVFYDKQTLLRGQTHGKNVEPRQKLQLLHVLLVFFNKIRNLLLSNVAVLLTANENEVSLSFVVL